MKTVTVFPVVIVTLKLAEHGPSVSKTVVIMTSYQPSLDAFRQLLHILALFEFPLVSLLPII